MPLSETVEFYATAEEAERTLEGIISGSIATEARRPAERSDVLWSRGGTFEGVVDLVWPGGLRCVLSIAPAGEDSAARPHYRATRQLCGLGDGSGIGRGELEPLARLMPFTDSEAEEIRQDMRLTRSVPNLFPGQPLAEYSVLFTIHHLSDFLPLIETAFALGVDPRDVMVIDKEYRYLHSERVDAHLRRTQQVRVRTYSELEAALTEHFELARRRRKRVLVLDDGGYVLPVVLDRMPEALDSIAGVVEQTTSGIRKVEHRRLPLPLFSVAQSHVKATVEAYGVADAAVRNTLALLPQEKFEGRPAMVLGYGRIGEEIANILRNRRMRVAVYDSDIVRLVSAHERGFSTDRNPTALLGRSRPLLVFGCVGADSLRSEQFHCIDWDCYLVSTTSRDREFALSELAELAMEVEPLGKLGTRYTLVNGAKVLVLGHGMPINFHYAESLPNRSIDLVLASVLVGACVLARDEPPFPVGIDVEAANAALRESGLLDSYYDLWRGETLASEAITA